MLPPRRAFMPVYTRKELADKAGFIAVDLFDRGA
jgi:hypothetical protein